MNVIHLYQPITSATTTEVQRLLASITAKEITVRINSPGGQVFEGLTIYQLLKSHPAKITVIIDGIAASIASIIALAGDQINIAQGGMIMVHDASIATRGNSRELVRDAGTVQKVSESLTDIYVSATKQPRAKIRQMMEAETWLNASEAIALNFAHRIVAGQKIAAQWTASDAANLPAAARIAAGLAPSRRDTSAEIDRLKSENLLLKQRLNGKAEPHYFIPPQAPAKAPPKAPSPEPVRTETPTLDKFNSLKGAMATLFFNQNAKQILAEQNVRTSEERAIERAKRNSQ